MNWLDRLVIFLACQPPKEPIVADFTALNDIIAKLDKDVTTKLAAKDAQIADLTTQLKTAAAADQPAVDAAIAALTATDAKLG